MAHPWEARRAVRMINANAVIEFDSCCYTDGESPEGSVVETPDKSSYAQ
ncbi:hypothetical protein [Microvirga calopogonii]|nr:hypothetical protein [Microvirga calopogonii]